MSFPEFLSDDNPQHPKLPLASPPTENDTIIMSRDDYVTLQDEISILEQNADFCSREGDDTNYNYDATMSCMFEEDVNAQYARSLSEMEIRIRQLELELRRYSENELYLKGCVAEMQKEIDGCNGKIEMYKDFAKEKIKEVEMERDNEVKVQRSRNDKLIKNIEDLNRVIDERSAENRELVEYCKYFINFIPKNS